MKQILSNYQTAATSITTPLVLGEYYGKCTLLSLFCYTTLAVDGYFTYKITVDSNVYTIKLISSINGANRLLKPLIGYYGITNMSEAYSSGLNVNYIETSDTNPRIADLQIGTDYLYAIVPVSNETIEITCGDKSSYALLPDMFDAKEHLKVEIIEASGLYSSNTQYFRTAIGVL